MTTERDGYGLQPFKRGAVATPGASASGAVIPQTGRGPFPADHINPSPVWTKARAEAFDAAQLTHEVSCAAFYIASGPFQFPSTSITWTLRASDHTRAATLTMDPLPEMSVRDLLKAGIITPLGVDEVAFRRACEELPR
jgi:hypothetical protein